MQCFYPPCIFSLRLKCFAVLSTCFLRTTEPSRTRRDYKCQYLGERRVHHGDVVDSAVGFHAGSKVHKEMSKRQEAQQVHDDVQQVSFAPIGCPANWNQGDSRVSSASSQWPAWAVKLDCNWNKTIQPNPAPLHRQVLLAHGVVQQVDAVVMHHRLRTEQRTISWRE